MVQPVVGHRIMRMAYSLMHREIDFRGFKLVILVVSLVWFEFSCGCM
jgi:hypothetical protein